MCSSARRTCTHARRSACLHESPARMFADLHACTSHLHACSPICMLARATCTYARRSACLHEVCPGMFADLHACSGHVHACSQICMHARMRCRTHSAEAQMPVCFRKCTSAEAKCQLDRALVNQSRLHLFGFLGFSVRFSGTAQLPSDSWSW